MNRRRFLQWVAGAPVLAVHAAQPVKLEIVLANGRTEAARGTLRVKKGDRVELHWSSDRPIALHLHGYDIEASVTPQSPAVMAFDARLTGRFPVTEHARDGGHHRAVLYLEVHP